MKALLKEEVISHGDRIQIIPVEHLLDLKEEINEFKLSEELNGFQNWIVNRLYNFNLPKANFEVKSILLLALAHPFCAEVEFVYSGKTYKCYSLVSSDFEGAEKYLKEFMEKSQYHIIQAENLPLKRLAVQSNFAVYGRNNISYVEGLGSNFSYAAYFTDMPCEKDEWRNMRRAEICDSCDICLKNCPTGAIRKERFLIDNQKCLSAMNETTEEIPQWVPTSAHHTLYDCLKCQDKCPINHRYTKNIMGTIHFSEDETKILLEGKSLDLFSEEFNAKVKTIGLDKWYEAIPRNLKLLMDQP